MNSNANNMLRPSLQQEAEAAILAMTEQSMADNLDRVTELSQGTDEAHVAEHVRGVVAATMSRLSISASAITQANAAHWQDWALDLADGVTKTVPTAA